MFDGIFTVTKGSTTFDQSCGISYVMDWDIGEGKAYLPRSYDWGQSFITPLGEKLKRDAQLRHEAYLETMKNVAYVSERS